ncbi:MAG: transporter, partial [Bifidobacteriaceae bacterium]|nr:transporter [Bifidobacteriaceae bacterium]
MHAVMKFLADEPILLIFLLIGLGSIVGRIKAKGVSLGSSAVLFVAIALSAWAHALGVTMEIPEVVGTMGLALFTFAVGIISGANFFASLRKGWRPILTMVGVLIVGAGLAYVVGRALGLSEAVTAGTFAGAITNTPALAAVRAVTGSDTPTVGYAVAYVYGVAGMLIFA